MRRQHIPATIGHVAGKAVHVDLDRLLASRLLLQANSGGGKSWAIRRLLEQTHGQVQQIVIDPEGEFYTLRERYDYVLAGRGGDCPAQPPHAHLLARRLLELGVSAVVDLYELKAHDRIRFVRRFLEAVIDAPKGLWHPVLVVIDEAHVFCPQKGDAESAAAVTDLMTRGRKRGFCGVLATQRISKLHKDAAAEANNYLIGRAALDIDMKRAAEELGLSGAAERQRLRRLKPGHFFSFGPALTDQVALLKVGAVRTSHPRAGASAAPPAQPSGKVKAVLAQLSDLPAEAEEEARSVQSLKAQVRTLRGELKRAQAEAPAPSEEDLKEVRAGAVRAAEIQVERIVGKVLHRDDRVAAGLDEALGVLKRTADALREPIDVELPEPDRRKRPGTGSQRTRRRPTPAPGLDRPMQRILDAVAWLETAGVHEPYTRIQVAFPASYKPSSGGYNNLLSRLCNKDGKHPWPPLLSYPSPGSVKFTDAGRSAANFPTAPGTPEELHEFVFSKINPPMKRCLSPLLESYPESMTREEVAEQSGYTAASGGFNNLLSRLRTLGLIDYPGSGEVIAMPLLFLE